MPRPRRIVQPRDEYGALVVAGKEMVKNGQAHDLPAVVLPPPFDLSLSLPDALDKRFKDALSLPVDTPFYVKILEAAVEWQKLKWMHEAGGQFGTALRGTTRE